MRVSKKTIIISSIVIVFVAVVIATVTIVKLNETKSKNLVKILSDNVDLQMKGFVYTEVGEGDSQWEVKAETATYYKKQNLALFDQVQIKLTMSDGKVYLMTGDKGQMLTDKKDLEIKGNVV